MGSFLNYNIEKEIHYKNSTLLILNKSEKLNFNFFENLREVEKLYHVRIETLVNDEEEFLIRVDFI